MDTKRIRDLSKNRGKIQTPENQGPAMAEDLQTRELLFKTFHDMRNPLQAIIGYTSLVLRKTRDQIPEKQQENLEKVLQGAEMLNKIVDRMIAFYRYK